MLLLALLLALALCTALVFFAGRWRDPGYGPLPVPPSDQDQAAPELSVTTWNLGFAGLGAEADFILDHGKHLRALNRAQIDRAAQEIGEVLSETESDILLLQENANAGFLTRGVPVRAHVTDALAGRQHLWWTDFATRFAPPFLRIDHGLSVHSRPQVTQAEAIRLSPEPLTHYGFLKKYYSGVACHLPIAGSNRRWVVINLHLSAFDTDPQAKVAQLESLFAYATQAHARGNPVVIGGDWNMEMAQTSFPHAPHLGHGEWTYDFPLESIPEGWKRVADTRVPSVRSMQQPYRPGENATMVIDGFIISPDVELRDIHCADLGFGPSDHHPVTALFALRS